MLTNEQIQALQAAAEKATPGRIGDRIDGSGSIKYECHGYDGSLVLKTDHKNMEYGFVGDNANADELFFRSCVPDFILSLLADREADKALITELQEALKKSQAQSSKWLEGFHKVSSIGARYEERIAELEARTLTVSIKPPTIGRAYSALNHVWTVKEVREACAAAGITLVVGGE